MPCYNDGKYINEAIESIKQQTYSDWELIIVDDGSEDKDTISILQNIKDDKVFVYYTDHLKPAGARNYGVSKSTGKYILPIDSDDKVHRTYIEKAVYEIEQNENIGVVYCKAELFGEKDGIWDLPSYSRDAMLLDNIVFVTALFYKEDWEKVGGFNTTMAAGMEDYDFWLSLMGLGREIYQIPEVLFYYRIKSKSRTTNFQSNYEQVQETYRQLYYNHKNFYQQNIDDYVTILRDALIEQIFIRRKYEERLAKFQKITDIPLVGKIIKKFIKKLEE